MSSIKSLILNFIADERGSQSAEYVIIGGVAAIGASRVTKGLYDAQKTKSDELSTAILDDPTAPGR